MTAEPAARAVAGAPLRFRPPAVEASPGLAWVLARAFSGELPPQPPDPDLALEQAGLLGLLPRIAMRAGSAVEAELGRAGAERLREERALALARELAFDEATAAVATVAERLGVRPVLLKGRALVAAGLARPGARPAADLDLLLDSRELDAFADALRRAGFRPTGARGHEQHAPPLGHPTGIAVELHDRLLGVRLDGRRSARRDELARAGLLEPAARLPGPLELPARAVLLAHAAVHALAQHGLAAQYRGWLVVGDLVDLAPIAPEEEAAARRWSAPALAAAEWDALLALARLAATGGDPFAAPEAPAGLLARHFVACALDPDYGEALKARRLEAPLSDRGRFAARLGALLHALVPPPEGDASERHNPRGSIRRWLARPFELIAKRRRAARAARLPRIRGDGASF